jgi:hypothetical protein
MHSSIRPERAQSNRPPPPGGPVVPPDPRRLAPVLLAAGILVLLAVWLFGLRTGSFLVHVVYPAGFWLTSDGFTALFGRRPLVRTPWVAARMILLGAGLGLLLDLQMVHLLGILALTAVSTPLLALAMYLGWGLSMPAAYSSYRLGRALLGRRLSHGRVAAAVPAPLVPALAALGLPLAELATFSHVWVGVTPTWFVVPVFTGFWLLAEYGQARRRRPSLLGAFLARDLRPLAAMALASLPFTLLWEGLDAEMHSWHYQHIFLLQPRPLGIPLVVYAGYLCGYYVIFLNVYGAVRREEETTFPLWGGPSPVDGVAV